MNTSPVATGTRTLNADSRIEPWPPGVSRARGVPGIRGCRRGGSGERPGLPPDEDSVN